MAAVRAFLLFVLCVLCVCVCLSCIHGEELVGCGRERVTLLLASTQSSACSKKPVHTALSACAVLALRPTTFMKEKKTNIYLNRQTHPRTLAFML